MSILNIMIYPSYIWSPISHFYVKYVEAFWHFFQSLLMVYAQLIQSQLGAVLNFLSSVPGPKGESGLHFVMTEWVNRQQMFYGAYENKVSLS